MVRRHLWLIPSVALVAIFPFVSGEALVPVMVLTGIFAIVVLGLDLVMGYTGLWAFGNNAFFAVGAYVSGVLTIKLGFASPLALLVALLFTCIVAYVVGMTSLRLEGLYFGIATLGFSVVVYSLAVGMVDLTSGPVGLRLVPKFSIAGLVFDTETSYFYLVWAALLVLFFFAWNLTHSRTGRALLAIREDQTAAESLGVNSTYYKVMIFVVSAAYASIGGSLFAHYQRVIFPDSFGLGTAIQFFLMLVLGGIGSLWGPILGTSLVRMLPTFLGRMDVYYLLFYGLIFILVIALFPKGLARGIQGLLLKIGQLEVFSRRLRPSPDLEFEAVQVSGRQQGSPVPAEAVARAKNPNGPILEARGLVKTFGGLLAVSDLAFAVPRQQLTAIIGPNGAGKTTVLNLITGIYPPTAG
ncbi:MAG: ATP-binding cassette domain-containing protein, partial [Chloroflexota bacterium]|nr:ATP-binding cassette domain-containing protein [Chloroflexota bacterium]